MLSFREHRYFLQIAIFRHGYLLSLDLEYQVLGFGLERVVLVTPLLVGVLPLVSLANFKVLKYPIRKSACSIELNAVMH